MRMVLKTVTAGLALWTLAGVAAPISVQTAAAPSGKPDVKKTIKRVGKKVHITIDVDNSKSKRNLKSFLVTLHVKGPNPAIKSQQLAPIDAGKKKSKTFIFDHVPPGKVNLDFKYDFSYAP